MCGGKVGQIIGHLFLYFVYTDATQRCELWIHRDIFQIVQFAENAEL